MRKRFNRHEAIADPGQAMQRAAMGAVGNGLKGVGEGLFKGASFAFMQVMQNKDAAKVPEAQTQE
jgi:hypothetical protein